MAVVILREGIGDGISLEHHTHADIYIVKLNGEHVRDFSTRERARTYIKLLLERANESAAQKLD